MLLLHNFYGSSAPSGENHVFDAERELLRNHGHKVNTLTRHSDELRKKGVWGTVCGAMVTPWNPAMFRAIRKIVDSLRPDVVHVHNTFPLLSPAIFHAIGYRAAKVLTLHNYRLFCPAAIPLRKGRTCTSCLDGGTVIPSLVHGCYRESRLATMPLAASVVLHRMLGTWNKRVDAFVLLSDFQKCIMTKARLPSYLVHVKPNFYPGKPMPVSWERRNSYVVFAGRLTVEKGVISLLRAWQSWGAGAPQLRLVGDGELREELEHMAIGLPVRFFGQVNGVEAQEQIAGASLLVLPSECFEGFPMVVREAFAFGTPVAVSNIGPLPSIVQRGVSGVVFDPANPDSLLAEVRNAWETPGLLQLLGHGARSEFETKYTEEANYDTLMEIYQQAVKVNNDRKNA